MTEVYDEEPTSGFLKPDEIIHNDRFADFSFVPSRGYSLLVRAKRYGRWWMLKGLKEPYRNDTVYQHLLKKEFEIISQLQHPMVISAISIEEVEGFGICIVMEWVDGLTLKEWLEQGNKTKTQRRHVADMLAEAISYVHSRQTQHRDLKPSNIMLTHNGQYLKLIDFGFSDTDSHTILKAPAGTEGYMAPDGPSDIYAFGCLLHELHLGWLTEMVVRKCCAPLQNRYKDIRSAKKALYRCWQWPRRALCAISLLFLIGFALFIGLFSTQSQHRKELKILNDSLQYINQLNRTNSEIILSTQSAVDSLQSQLSEFDIQQHIERDEAMKRHEEDIQVAKRNVDKIIQSYGIQQMMDTVTCQTYITIPFLRIVDELMRDIQEPELKEYIEKRYRTPWIKRMNELPFNHSDRRLQP